MANYSYTAKNAKGETVTGTVNGSSSTDAMQKLRKQNLVSVKVKDPSAKINLSGKGAQRVRAKKGELELFTRQLATMISSGIPLLECLEILKEQAESPGFRAVIATVVEDIRGGSDLSIAMSKYTGVFSEIYCSMIRAGEASGQLDEILVRLAEYLEASAQLRREIKAAMTYPVISLVLVTGITMFLMIAIVPKFKEIFDGIGVELPSFTKMVMGASMFLKHNVTLMIGIMVGTFFGVGAWKKTTSGKTFFDHVMMRMPVFGPLFRKVALSRFSRTFSTLIKSGVPILGALEIVADTAGNSIIAKAVRHSLESVRTGQTLADPLSEHWIFPPMVTRMIGIGEKTGALEQLLGKISDFYDQQVEASVKSLTSLIEPLMIGIMGFMVGGIVLAVFMPIMKLQQALTPK